VNAITLESQVAPKRGERTETPSTFKIPLNRFGPYTPNTASKGCHPTKEDKWAFGTCTLMKALGPNKVAAAAEGENERGFKQTENLNCLNAKFYSVIKSTLEVSVQYTFIRSLPCLFHMPLVRLAGPPVVFPFKLYCFVSDPSTLLSSTSFPGAGWVSGWLTSPVPPQCSSLSAAACSACSSSPDPTGCLGCMKDTRAVSYIDSISLVSDGPPADSVGSRTLDQCLACAKLGDKSQQKQ